MKQSFFTVLAAAVLAACGRPDTAPEPGSAAPGDTPAAQVAEDTMFRGTDGVMTDPGSGAESGSGVIAAAPASGGTGTQPARPPQGGSEPATPGSGATAPDPGASGDAAVPAAQADGAALLRRASSAYENVRSLQADFVMNFENPLLRQRLVSRGTLYQRQPDRIALRFSDPAGDIILGDGQYFYMYQPSNNPDQYFRQPAAAAGETGVNLQAQFVGNPVERFNFTHEGAESVGGRNAQVMTLVPRQRADYRSLRVWIDDRDALVRRFEITEHNGNVRRFDLQNMQVNPSIGDAVFRFTPPAGARAITPG